VALSTGTHTLTLKVTAPSGLTAQVQTHVNVKADTDRDGLSDEYEIIYTCMSFKLFDSDSDPDGDGLANLGEQALNSDPCVNDTDQDGFNDGDETWLGSSLLKPNATLPQDELALAPTTIQLDCLKGDPQTNLLVQTLYPTTTWQTASDVGWLSADFKGTGDGTIPISTNCAGLASGVNTGQILVSVGLYQARIINVELSVPTRLFLPLILMSQ
jgi:hypothetical protein